MVYKKALIGILILTFFLRLPSLFEPFVYGDEGIYLTLGEAVRQGLVLYKDIHDNKPPLLYFLAAITYNFSCFRLLLFFWSLITVYFFFKLAEQLFSSHRLAVLVTTFLFALFSSIRTFEGNIGNAENFMLLPTIVGFLFLIKNWASKKRLVYILSGMIFSMATLLKVPAGFDFLAALVFVFLASKKPLNLKFQDLLFLIIGFSLPILATIIYFAYKEALDNYLQAAFFQNIPYLSSWVPDKPRGLGNLPLPLLIRALLVFLLVLIIFFFKKRFSQKVKLILIWFAFSLFAALLSSRPYPHYLLQIIPSFSLSWGLIFQKSKARIIPFILLLVFVLTFFIFHFWHYQNFSYYINFYSYVLGQKEKEEYFGYFGGQTKTIYQVADYIQSHTQPGEKIFIWGTVPSIYALSRRLPSGRYTVAYHIIDFNGYQETIAFFKKQPPLLIIKMKDENNKFPELEAYLASYYSPIKIIDKALIFRRLP